MPTPYIRPQRGDAVAVIDWTNVPTGGDPFRGEGTFLYSENAVAMVEFADGSRRGFNLGDVSPIDGPRKGA